MTDHRHAGRGAFVTGAGSGIGRAIAVRLAAEGCAVACTDINHDTGFTPGADPRSPQIPPAVRDRLLIPRLGQPEDIAAAVSFLLSDNASFITGTQLVVDGGWLAR